MKEDRSEPRFNMQRRQFIKVVSMTGVGLYVGSKFGFQRRAIAQIPGGTLAPGDVPKYVTPMLIPPVMPRAGTVQNMMGKNADYYEISMKQFDQQILPPLDVDGAQLNPTPFGAMAR